MSTDVNKTRDELLNELKQYRETVVENDLLRERLKRAEDECQTLQTRLEKRDRDFIRERAEHITAVKELGMAQLIVDKQKLYIKWCELYG